MRIRDLVTLIRQLPVRIALRILTASPRGRIHLAELLEPKPDYIGPIAKLKNRTLVSCGDHFMWILNGDEGVGRGVLKKGSWQRDDFEASINLIKGRRDRLGGVFLDIGANIGTHSIYAALSGQFDRIIAVEPEDKNAALFRDNFSLNDLNIKFDLIKKAAGKQKGVSYLSLHDSDSGMHSLAVERTESSVEVEVDTIPSILKDLRVPPEEVAFVWMDIERGEFKVFPTIEDLLRLKTPVFFEYGRFAVSDEEYNYWSDKFDQYGYECFVVDRGVVSGSMKSSDALNIDFGNVLLV